MALGKNLRGPGETPGVIRLSGRMTRITWKRGVPGLKVSGIYLRLRRSLTISEKWGARSL